MATESTRIAGGVSDAVTEVQQRLRILELCVEVLIGQTKLGMFWLGGYEEANRFLESIPLATYEFNLAKVRLKNAFDYCQRGEFGAAAFELRALRGNLQSL
jgi:hypothetical protein